MYSRDPIPYSANQWTRTSIHFVNQVSDSFPLYDESDNKLFKLQDTIVIA